VAGGPPVLLLCSISPTFGAIGCRFSCMNGNGLSQYLFHLHLSFLSFIHSLPQLKLLHSWIIFFAQQPHLNSIVISTSYTSS
jgi:hypothetical protein